MESKAEKSSVQMESSLNTNKEGNYLVRLIQNHYTVVTKSKSERQLEREKWLIPRCIRFNRWWLMPASFIIQFCCGSLYSWSVYNKPIDLLIYGEDRHMAPITFYIAVGFLGAASALMGPVLEAYGPFLVCVLGTSLFFLGHLMTALALHLKQIWLVFIGYGIICGYGLGVCYISPVSALQKWFPDKRGLAAGFAVSGFGAGSIVISKIQLPLIEFVGLPLTFVIIGSTFFVLMIVSATVLRTPPHSTSKPNPATNPVNSISSCIESEVKCNGETIDIGESNGTTITQPSYNPNSSQLEMTLVEAITSKDFRFLMIMFSSSIIFGLVLLSRLADIIIDVFEKSREEASTIVAINGGFNLAGRILIGVVSDYIGRKNCFIFMLTLQVIILGSFSTMTLSKAYWPFVITMWLITACYGAGFGIIPAFLSDKFGPRNIGACHGIILTGWSLAGIGGGLIFTLIFNSVQEDISSVTDPYPYNINVAWLFIVVSIGASTLHFIKPTKQDMKFI